MVDVITPTFDNLVQNYYDRRSALLKNGTNMSAEEVKAEVESLEKTRQHLATFDIKVVSPLPQSKGRPS